MKYQVKRQKKNFNKKSKKKIISKTSIHNVKIKRTKKAIKYLKNNIKYIKNQIKITNKIILNLSRKIKNKNKINN